MMFQLFWKAPALCKNPNAEDGTKSISDYRKLPTLLFLIGVSLLIIGAQKIAHIAELHELLSLSLCGAGGELSGRLSTSFLSAHCDGCTHVAFGAFFLVAAGALHHQQSHRMSARKVSAMFNTPITFKRALSK